MWTKWSFERRTYAGLGVLVLVLIIGYYTSIAKAFDAYAEYKSLRKVNQSMSIAEFSSLQKRFNTLDSTYSIIAGIDYDNLLIKEVNHVLNRYNVQIAELQNESIGKNDIDVITFTGKYKDLVKVMYYMERHFYAGSLFSSRFRVEKNNKTKITSLYLDMYMQRIKDEEVN